MKNIIIMTSIALLAISCNRDETTTVEPAGEPAVAAGTTTATPYPLDVCIVSGEELGSMGEPVVLVHEGREVKFCCAECLPGFNKDPEKYLSKLDQ